MLSSTIALNVDVANNGTIVVQNYERRSPSENTFLGPSHNMVDAVVDELSVAVKLPKPTTDFKGNVRGTLKFQKSVTLTDGTKPKLILELAIVVPVGASAASVVEMCQKGIAFLDVDSVIGDIVFRGES